MSNVKALEMKVKIGTYTGADGKPKFNWLTIGKVFATNNSGTPTGGFLEVFVDFNALPEIAKKNGQVQFKVFDDKYGKGAEPVEYLGKPIYNDAPEIDADNIPF